MTGDLQGRPSPRRRAWAVRSLFRPTWQQEGHEPDYRFSLANERTFLGWLRTALAFMAGAVAVSQLLPEFGVNGLRDVLAALLAAAGAAVPTFAYRRWARYQRAMRHDQPLPSSPALLAAAAVGTLLGALVLTIVIVTSSQ